MGCECGEARDARSVVSCLAAGGTEGAARAAVPFPAAFPCWGRNSAAARRALVPPRGALPEERAEGAGDGAACTMVATRRAARRRDAAAAGGDGPGPGGATEVRGPGSGRPPAARGCGGHLLPHVSVRAPAAGGAGAARHGRGTGAGAVRRGPAELRPCSRPRRLRSSCADRPRSGSGWR